VKLLLALGAILLQLAHPERIAQTWPVPGPGFKTGGGGGGGGVAFDAIMGGGNADSGHVYECDATTTCTAANAMTIGGSATCLVVTVVTYGIVTGARTMSWHGGSNITAAVTQVTPGNINVASMAFVFSSPDTGGPYTLVGTADNSNQWYISAVSFSATNTSTCYNAANNGAVGDVKSIDAPSSSTGATVSVYAGDGYGPTAWNQQRIFMDDNKSAGGSAQYAIGGSPTVTHTYTETHNSTHAIVSVNVVAP